MWKVVNKITLSVLAVNFLFDLFSLLPMTWVTPVACRPAKVVTVIKKVVFFNRKQAFLSMICRY